MRIIAGTHGGRKLTCPPGQDVRPTADRVKEALFSILSSDVEEVDVLDLFAGSGSLGLEALSRGAKRAVFVERHGKSLGALQKNIASLGEEGRTLVLKADLEKKVPTWVEEKVEGYSFEVIFLDPPIESTKMNPFGIVYCPGSTNYPYRKKECWFVNIPPKPYPNVPGPCGRAKNTEM